MNITLTYNQALEKASPVLRKKMEHSVSLLRKTENIALLYDAENGFWCGFSGGKDSQALLHIAQLSGVKYKPFFSPTSVDPPRSDKVYSHAISRSTIHRIKEKYL